GNQFDQLLSLIGTKIEKKTTRLRKPISPSERLALCLRFLATGGTYADLSFRIGKSTVCNIIREICEAICQTLGPLWKHIAIQALPNAGSSYINYKGFHSLVLMAASDAHYRFLYVDIGNYGRISDGAVLDNSSLGRKLQNSNFLLDPALLPESNKVLPFVFIADEAFPLKTNMLRPFPGKLLPQNKRIFNYRLARARRCIENAFGILTARWRVLRNTLNVQPDKADRIVFACCCLHNFLMRNEMGKAAKSYCPFGYADFMFEDGSVQEGMWRQDEGHLQSVDKVPIMLPNVQLPFEKDSCIIFLFSLCFFLYVNCVLFKLISYVYCILVIFYNKKTFSLCK
ncbi:protein ALP1-like, partial [Stegodyphus dumicola]|uniref:protein ALP1-like n=1 Tax=Stegodyphus dumicola TaxID=202533 RepID=UPI0015ABC733